MAIAGNDGRLIALEGLDGAGKRTVTEGLAAEFRARGLRVTQWTFPRYGASVYADLVAEALRGGHGDLGESVYGMAALYALDRRAAADELRKALADYDVVLVDRYVASNAAYGAARLKQDAGGEFVAWVRQTEIERFELPQPAMQLLLTTSPDLAAQRARQRGRDSDRFETDSGLQERCAEVYRELAQQQWWSPWREVDNSQQVNYVTLAASLVTPGRSA